MGPEGPEAGSTSDSADAGEAQGKPRRRRRGGRGRRRPSGRVPQVAGQSAGESAPDVAAPESPAVVTQRPPRARHAERPSPRPEPVRDAPPADDFGFDADAPAAIEPAAAEDANGAPRDDGDLRRRRRRRGGRGRRRRSDAPDAAAPSDGAIAAPAPEPRVAPPETADEFGALLDDSAGAAAPSTDAEPARPAEQEDGARKDDRPRSPRRERRGPEAQRQSSRTAPFPPTPHGVDDWFSPARLEACQRAIHYHFRDMSLLENALTHSSIKSHDRPSYERMEFLGDSVIGLVIAEYLYNLLPDCDEGELTKVKSLVVSTDGLADAAKDCGLDKFLAVGRGILMKDAVPRSLIADVFEGVVGAVYLDRGYETVRLYVLDLLGPRIKEAISDRGARNFKSVLQQVAQRDFGETPFYEVLRESGPEHARVFEVVAVVGRRRFGVARAATKKEAEQAAAKLALQTILMEKSSRKPPPRRRRSR